MRGKPRSTEASFAVQHTHCAALDVHKDSIIACALTPGGGDEPRSEVRQFGTTTGELEALGRWLLERVGWRLEGQHWPMNRGFTPDHENSRSIGL